MSSPAYSQRFADIRDGARRMLERTRVHEGDLNGLVATADGVARQATALTAALTQAQTDAAALGRLCSEQARLSVAHAEATVRACVSAREQHVEARRLYGAIDGPAGPQGIVAPRPAAVLVVDDVEDIRDLIALVLRNAGFFVRTAVNGLEGLLTAYEMRPDVIVMDVTMPVLGGLEATRLIKATSAHSRVEGNRPYRKRLDPADARGVVRRHRIEAIAAGHRPRGCAERGQSMTRR